MHNLNLFWKQKVKKQVLGIDKIRKLVLRIKKRHKTSFGDIGKGKGSPKLVFCSEAVTPCQK
jgi:hypothetical protein